MKQAERCKAGHIRYSDVNAVAQNTKHARLRPRIRLPDRRRAHEPAGQVPGVGVTYLNRNPPLFPDRGSGGSAVALRGLFSATGHHPAPPAAPRPSRS
eukprot:scaffold25009_cov128-Isochrysis_galbana.AAC.3